MNSFRNDNDLLPEISARIQSEWLIDLSETSMTISHTSTGLRFRFEKDQHLKPRAKFLDHEDHPQFEDIFDEASQIAEQTASEEWRS